MDADEHSGDILPDTGDVDSTSVEIDRPSCNASSFAAMLANLNQISDSYIHRYSDDNFSLEVNFGDGGSCQLSDVSSVSFQNVTQDDLDSLDCDSGTAAQNSLDSNSERSDSPVDFENDKGDIKEAEFSNCLEAELRMKVSEHQSIDGEVPIGQEDANDFSLCGESVDTGTMKRRFREADQTEKISLKSDGVNNEYASCDGLEWLLTHDDQGLSSTFGSYSTDKELQNFVYIGQEVDDGNDENPYQYSPPIGLTSNGLSKSNLLSRSGVPTSSDNCYVTLEFNRALNDRAILKMKKSPGVARRVGDVCTQLLIGSGKNVSEISDDNNLDSISGVEVADNIAAIAKTMDGIHTSAGKQPCIKYVNEGNLKSRNPPVCDEVADVRSVCNGLATVSSSCNGKSPEHSGNVDISYTAHDVLLAELVQSAESPASSAVSAVASSTKVSEDMLTEISLNGSDHQQGDCKTFSLSPEATDCDSADIASVLSEDVSGMPFVEDGLSSSQCSDADDTPKHSRKTIASDSHSTEIAFSGESAKLHTRKDLHREVCRRESSKTGEGATVKSSKELVTSVACTKKKLTALSSNEINEEEDDKEATLRDIPETVDVTLEQVQCNQDEKQENGSSISVADLLKLPARQIEDNKDETSPSKG